MDREFLEVLQFVTTLLFLPAMSLTSVISKDKSVVARIVAVLPWFFLLVFTQLTAWGRISLHNPFFSLYLMSTAASAFCAVLTTIRALELFRQMRRNRGDPWGFD